MGIADPQIKPTVATQPVLVALNAGPAKVAILPSDTTRTGYIITNPLGSGLQAFLSFVGPGAPALTSATCSVELSPGESLIDSGRGVFVGPISGNASGALSVVVTVFS